MTIPSFWARDEKPPLLEDAPQWWFQYVSRDPKGIPNGFHMVPYEEPGTLVHLCDGDGGCVCGPHRVDVDGNVPQFRHWPLSDQYYAYGETRD